MHVLALTRNIYTSVEQPLASLLFWDISFKTAMRHSGARYFFFWMGGYGGLSMKPSTLFTTLPKGVVDALYRSKQQATTRLGDAVKPLTVRTPRSSKSATGWSQTGWVSGDKAVQSLSAEYPCDFCEAYATAIVSVLCEDAREDALLLSPSGRGASSSQPQAP